jgi:hypothetical protein
MRKFVRYGRTSVLAVVAAALLFAGAPAATAYNSSGHMGTSQLNSQSTSHGAGSHPTRHPPADWWW